MTIPFDSLAQKLAAALSPDAVTREPEHLADHSVDGKQPGIVCLPRTPDDVAIALRLCAEAKAAVVPRGSGTAMRLGNAPRAVDIVIGLARLDRVIEHDDANLTATAQAGTKISALQETLARQSQFLALEPPFADRASVGGTVAANLNGPRRMFYGGVRDLVIGIKAALIGGEPIKGGGKVVKNVAGYDMCKLFSGSLGTLGIITEATFKLAPVPESAATILTSGSLTQALRFANEIMQSTLLPAAVTLLNREATKTISGASDEATVAVRSEGFEQAVARHLRDLSGMAERHGLKTEELPDMEQERFWERIRDFPLATEQTVCRLVVPLASVHEVMKKLGDASTRVVADAGTGTVWAARQSDERISDWFTTLVELARESGGHTILLSAPPEVKQNIDVWGPPPPSLRIMRALKRQFDPDHLLNPGRFLGGP